MKIKLTLTVGLEKSATFSCLSFYTGAGKKASVLIMVKIPPSKAYLIAPNKTLRKSASISFNENKVFEGYIANIDTSSYCPSNPIYLLTLTEYFCDTEDSLPEQNNTGKPVGEYYYD